MLLTTCFVMAAVHGVAASTWVLNAESLPKKEGSEELNLRYMASVGNGHIATVVYSPTVYMNGLYNGPQGWSHRAAIQSQHDLTLSVAGETNRNHALDMWRGMFLTTIETASVVIKHRTYAHQHYTQLLVTEIVVDRKQDAEASVVTVNLTRSEIGSTVDVVLDNITENEVVERCPSRCFQTRGQTFTTESPRAQIGQVFLYWTHIPDVITLDAGTRSNKWTYFTSMDANEQRCQTVFQSAALRLFESSERNDPDILLKSHLSAWADKWNQGRVDVGGNDVLSRLIHSSLYYILSSLPSTDPNQPNEQFYGLSPGGLANGANGTDYQGHVFWDMETWMYPPILMLYPGLAKDMLSYRIHGMDPAYDRARSGGYEGLRYPWESAYTGDEQTPDICVPCRENQQHITGDIALAARQYISATRDVDWLRDQGGYIFIRDMAKFWKSRPTWNQQKQAYEINGIMPPDEYARYINNSIYTNIGARNSIHFARYAACLTDIDKFNEVGADWLNVADNLYIPFDDSRKYHPEYEGYDYTNIVNDSHIVKQADVIMLGFPLMLDMDTEVRRNDLMIYENVTDLGGPAMTWSMFSINWLELGEEDKADQMFDQSHALYAREPFNVWTEARAEIGAVNFITGMGGFLQALIFGYGGARLHPERLDFDPKLPRNTTSLRLAGLDYLGNSFSLNIFPSKVIVTVQNRSETLYKRLHLRLKATGTEWVLKKGRELVIPRQAFSLYTVEISDCPLPEGSSCPTIITPDGAMVDEVASWSSADDVNYVVVSKTGGDNCTQHWTCVERVRQLKQQEQDVRVNFYLGEDGRIYEGAGWNISMNSRINTSSLNIAVIGDFSCSGPNDFALRSYRHLIKCAVAKNIVSPNFTLLGGRQTQLPSDFVSDHDRLMCRIMSDRHWTEYQRGGQYTAPRCSGECFSPIPKPTSQYDDISDDPTVFQTDSLPRKDNSDEIDFRYMTSVSNGHLATLVYSPTIYVNGLYNGPTGWSHRARIPSTQALTANISGHPVAKRLYALDVKRGVFEETLTTPTAKVILRLYAHQYYTRLLVSEVTVHRLGDNSDTITVTLANHPGEPSTDINFQPEVDVSRDFQNCLSECHYQTGVTLVTESNTTDPRSVHIYNTMVQESVMLPAAVTNKTWVFLSSIDMFDEYAKDTFKKALDLLKDDVNSLYTSHVEAWTKRWARGHIEIDGDTYLSKRIYGSFYYLLSFLPAFDPYIKNNQFYGLSPGGLANGANWTDYQGHVFWDMETWMYPTMLMFHPKLAKDMLSYRTYAMGPAYERAAEDGYGGLRFPWESALTGVEQTPDICVPCRENQLHITGDIGLAARQYLTVTRDVDWLEREKGFQLLRDMANFWATRPTYDEQRDTYSINGVMPPDEHAQSINNSAYTNVGAKLSVYFARFAACLAGKNVTGEVPDSWMEVIDRLFVPFNEEKQYHPEFEGFEDWTDERGVKQADTIMLGYPQMWPMTSEVRRNDLVAYEKVTNPLGPAMTWGMFAIGWLELGDEHKAHELFHRSYSPYVREPFKIWTEAMSGIGAVNFITGMGGFLQALFFGYGGARIFTEHMEFDPRVPPGNTALRFLGTNYLGNSLDIEIYSKKVIVMNREASAEYPLILRITGTGSEHWLQEGKEIVISRVPFSIRTHKVTDCLLPKDEVLRGKNCPHIIARSVWKADNKYETETRSAAANYVVVDHTAWGTCTDLATCTRAIRHIQDWHQKIGYPDIAYNFLIGEDGRLYEGRGWDVVPGNVTDHSRESISIGLVGVFRCKQANMRIQETLQRLTKCGIELGKINTDYHLVGGTGMEGDMATVPLALHCQLRTWKHWWSEDSSWHRYCDMPCDDATPILPGAAKDTSSSPTVFTSDRLPTRDDTGETDFRFMPSVGNGHLATVALSPTVYVNGLYNGPIGWSHRARIPSFNSLHLTVSGVSEADTTRTFSLDVKRAVFTETIDTPMLTIEHRVYAHQYYARLLITEVIVTRKAVSEGQDVIIYVGNSFQSNFTSEDIQFEPRVNLGREDLCPRWNCWRTKGTTLIPERQDTPLQDIYIAWYEIPDTLTLHTGSNTDRWIYMTAIDQTIDRSNMNFEAGRRDFMADNDLVFQRHVDAWTTKWNNGHIEIKDNLQLAKLVHGSFYYIMSSLPSEKTYLPTNQFYGLSPGGLANGANWTDYQGHVFWDMETWMYPPILMFHPGLAKAMLSYRIYAMPPSYARAASGGYEGLRYPWEGASSGAEVTPDICVPCRENQQHVTGDIAFAARQYLSATRDMHWLKHEKGYEFIRDMGKFWITRPSWNEDKQAYEINGVMPPDEHQISINNSVYTNIGAKLSVHFANYASCLAGERANTTWTDIADKIYIPFDERRQYHPEFEGYEDVTGEKAVVKQADTILTGFPQMWPMTREVRRNDLELYDDVTTPLGPAMTWGMFSIGWLELGDEAKAKELFHKSYSLYAREPFKIWTEARSGIGAVNFITGMGGFLQTVLFGYGGARLHVEKLDFDPKIIPGTSGMRLVSLDYLGSSLDVDIGINTVHVVKTKSSEHDIELIVNRTGQRLLLERGNEVVISREAFSIRGVDTTDCPLPEGTSCPVVLERSTWWAADVDTYTARSSVYSNVVVYQTGGDVCEELAKCKRMIHHIQGQHIKMQHPDIAYNFIIDNDGNVYEGRGWDRLIVLTGDYADSSMAVGFLGDFTCSRPSERALAALKRLVKCGVEKKKISAEYSVLSERQVKAFSCPTPTCPGDRLLCALKTWRHWKAHQTGGEFREPHCDGLCLAPTATASSVSKYSDISDDPDIFSTDKLPLKDNSEEIDFRYMASVGNGHLAALMKSDTIYVNGLYNGPKGWSHRARIPATQALTVTPKDGDEGPRVYSLYVKKGIFEEVLTLPGVKVTQRTYAHQYYNRLLVTDVIFTRTSATEDIVFNVVNNHGDPSEDITFMEPEDYVSSMYKFQEGRTRIPEIEGEDTQSVYLYYTTLQSTLTFRSSEESKTYCVITSIDPDRNVARNNFDEALRIMAIKPELLYQRHHEAWRNKWDGGRIDVDGNTKLSKLINSCFYYLMSFLPAIDTFLPNRKFGGLSPGGLANGGNWTDYQGHVFWDMETWMYPTMLMFHPELGEQMLSYRINNMEPAYDRARSGGYEGLRYPWESAQTGVEVTPDICPACRENQQHVTGDIALAARQYVAATRDIDWLNGKKGYVFLKDMARFWKSRPTYNPETLQYDINGVMPPDEHAEFVNNSVYTNVGAKLAINFGRYAACLAGKDAHSEVPDDWLEVSRKIALLFDENENFHPEYEGYTDEKDPRGVKQADVVLLGYPQMWPMPEDVRKNDLVRYERVNNPLGPAMTWGMFSIAWLELGDEEKAAEMFERSYGLYNREPFKIWTEARQGIGAVNFLTGMGGFLQAVFFGYGGARLHTESLDFDPRLPPDSRGMRFSGFNYLGNSIDMEIKADHVSLLLGTEFPPNQLLLTVKKTGAIFRLKPGKEFLMPRQAFSLQSLDVTDCPLPEETSCPQIVGRREWGAADAKEAARKVDHVTKVLIHQTGGPMCQTLDACKRHVRHIQYMHQEMEGDSDVPYNFLVGKDGRVYEGRGWGVMPQQEDDSISIGFIGDFTCTDPADIYIHAVKRLIKCAVEMGHLSENYHVKYESQVGITLCTASRCPGDRLFCAVTMMKHWESQTDRRPDCLTPCEDVTETTSTNLYPDSGHKAHLFETDRLPMAPGSDVIDFRYMASVANGHLGTVVYSDTIYVNGLYNGPFGWSHRARIPSTQAIRIQVDGQADVHHYYSLDTEKAVFEEKLTTPDTEIIIRTYAHQKHTRLLITEIRAKRLAESLGQVTMTLTNNRGDDSDDIAFNDAQTYRGDYWKQTGQTKQTETADTLVSNVAVYYAKLPNKLILKSGVASETWVFFTAIDKDGRVAKASFDDAISLVESSKDSLYESHVTAWSERWSRGRVLVEGNVLLSKLINGCFYYLLSFLPSFDPSFPNDQFYGLSPGGLANGANWTDYQGHVFWDMETWMYPGILAFHPELAKAMLSYRIYGMDEAYKRAREGGYKGLRFPWESAFTGAEQTPEICVPCRENQQHITGDIALAARQYLTVTRDMDWLKDKKGYQLIRDMGEFWTSRVTWNEQSQKYDIRDVMPPDEHAINVTNSVYTNVGAKLSINFARYAACLNNMTDDVGSDWSKIADQIALPYDDVKMFHPEYEGYQDGDDDRGVKQADVILLGYPQMWQVQREVRRNDLVKYEKVTNVMGPAMTWGMFSIGWLELDQEDKAEELFHRSYRPYVREPFRVWTETRAGIGAVNFITGMGGFLQSVIFGYGGLRIHTEGLSFNPRVLPGSKGLFFEGLDYLGNSLDIRIRSDHVSVVVRKTSSFPLILRVDATSAVYHLHQDEEVLLPRQPFSIRTTELSECPLPEESSCPEIVKRLDWGSELSRPRGSPSLENYVVVHQTGGETCTNWRDCTLALQNMQFAARSSGKQDLRYNFLVGGDGRVYEGRGWNAVGDFADNFNTEAIGVAVIGDFTYNRPSKLVVSQIRRIIKCGMERNKIAMNYTLLWEKQVAPSTCTSCAGDQLLCQLMTFKHWSNHQVGGEFLDPECGTVPTATPSPLPTHRPGPTVTCGAASPSHALLTLTVLSYVSIILLK